MWPEKAPIFLLLGVCFAVCEAAERNPFLTEEGKLRQQLQLRDGQEGFVGVSGEILTIEPSGNWSAARFINERIDKPNREGRLTPQDLATLAQVLEASNLRELPARFGRDVKINRRLVTLRFGERSSTLVLNPGESLAMDTAPGSDDPHARSWAGFITIVSRVKSLLKVDQ